MNPVSATRSLRLLAAIACTLMPLLPSAWAQQQHSAPGLAKTAVETLPNGAASIRESYGDWIVDCRLVEGRKVCTFSQARGNQQTGQRSFAIELKPPRDGKTDGVLVLPFGLLLSAGVKLSLDDKPLGQTVPFSTCVPDGCLVPVSFPTVAIDAIKKGKVMTIGATPSGGAEPVVFPISLEGLAAAHARISELAK